MTRAHLAPGLIIAAPASGSGKTTITLGMLRALGKARRVGSLKAGPDYIDPSFHNAASGRPCFNLDGWAMRGSTLGWTLVQASQSVDLLVTEGVMGLFDGAPGGEGSTADLAARLRWPVVLVVDASGMAASAAALVHGFATYRDDVSVGGVIFNRVGSLKHLALLREVMTPLAIPVLGGLLRSHTLNLPERHLGLVPAGEHSELESFIDRAADAVAEGVDLAALVELAKPPEIAAPPSYRGLSPLGQRVAVAKDEAFAFIYPALLDQWRTAGAEVQFFSPLADEAPPAHCDAVYLPGGYPELHGGRLSGNRRFLSGLRKAAEASARIYGECGGYMTLGLSLIDADGVMHPMAGLLPVHTSFAEPRLTLGYRQLRCLYSAWPGNGFAGLNGHEFHFATEVERVARVEPLFHSRDALGHDLGHVGAQCGNTFGSFIHLVDGVD